MGLREDLPRRRRFRALPRRRRWALLAGSHPRSRGEAEAVVGFAHHMRSPLGIAESVGGALAGLLLGWVLVNRFLPGGSGSGTLLLFVVVWVIVFVPTRLVRAARLGSRAAKHLASRQ